MSSIKSYQKIAHLLLSLISHEVLVLLSYVALVDFELVITTYYLGTSFGSHKHLQTTQLSSSINSWVVLGDESKESLLILASGHLLVPFLLYVNTWCFFAPELMSIGYLRLPCGMFSKRMDSSFYIIISFF